MQWCVVVLSLEKALLFNSMLKFRKLLKWLILQNEVIKVLEKQERIVDQAIRTCTMLKNRQTRAQDAWYGIVRSL